MNDVNRNLGMLAFRFRSANPTEREIISVAYAEEVDRLIATKTWNECPAMEDQLPDDFMPRAFFDYWLDENLSRGMPG